MAIRLVYLHSHQPPQQRARDEGMGGCVRYADERRRAGKGRHRPEVPSSACTPPACSLPSSTCVATATATALHLPFSETRGVDRRREYKYAPTISGSVRAWNMRASKRNEGAGSWDGWEENADDEARVRWEADGSAAQLPPLAARSPQTTGGRSARPTSHALQSLVGLCGFGPLR